jgi:hypothetical protein
MSPEFVSIANRHSQPSRSLNANKAGMIFCAITVAGMISEIDWCSFRYAEKIWNRCLATHHPSLQTSDCLFPEWASFDFTTLDHQGYRQTIQKIGRIQRQLLNNIKFDLITHYQLGHLHYLVTTPGMIDPSELPIGWGLLEIASDDTINERTVPTHFNQIGSGDWLVRIAQASTAKDVRAILTAGRST